MSWRWLAGAAAVVGLTAYAACTIPSSSDDDPITTTTTTTLPEPNPTPKPPTSTPPPCETVRPNASVTSPPGGFLVTTPTVEITASASDNDVIDRVEFWYHIDQRGTLGPAVAMDPPTYIGDDQAQPYQITWSVPKMCNAIAAIYVWAYDRCGNAGRSSTVQIRVCN